MSDLVSVVLCTYNGELFVDEQVKTICSQTWSKLEIIIVDDASTDKTYEKLKRHAAIDTRIRLFQNEKNLGFNLNFNRACSLTKGTFIAIADQDDIWEKNKISELLKEITKSDRVMIAHSVSARFEKNKDPFIKSVNLVDYFEGDDPKKLFLFNTISGHNMLIRRKLLEAAMPFPENIYYDWWLSVVACTMGEIKHVNKILVWHRVHESNATGAAKPVLPFYEQVKNIVSTLVEKANIKEEDKLFGRKILNQYQKFPARKFSLSLFLFLLANRKIVFSHKKRKVPLIAHIKNAFKYSRRKTKA
jgi:glycosyltransferase involved in cell wall biosynthesis